MEYVEINGTQFHWDTVSNMKKEEFFEAYGNSEFIDAKDVWKQIQELKKKQCFHWGWVALPPLFFMELLNKLLERVLQLDERYLINQILNNQEIKNWLIKMNKEQLFVDGVNNLGIKLDVADKVGGYTVSGFYKGYSPFTKEKKKEKGLPSDHVTLYDTGEFYDSFKVEID